MGGRRRRMVDAGRLWPSLTATADHHLNDHKIPFTTCMIIKGSAVAVGDGRGRPAGARRGLEELLAGGGGVAVADVVLERVVEEHRVLLASTRARTHARKHAYTPHAHAHARIHTIARTRARTHARARARARIHNHARAHTHTHTHSLTHARKHEALLLSRFPSLFVSFSLPRSLPTCLPTCLLPPNHLAPTIPASSSLQLGRRLGCCDSDSGGANATGGGAGLRDNGDGAAQAVQGHVPQVLH